jgi:hypothetical protein
MGNLKKDEDKSLKKSLRKTVLFSGFHSRLQSEFWTKKNGREYLETLFNDQRKFGYYYYSLRIFLLRNIKTTFTIFKSQNPCSIVDSKTSRGTSTRRFSTQTSKVSLSQEIKDRRRRSFNTIIEDLWSRVEE